MARFGGSLIAGVLALGVWALPAAASVQYSTLKPLQGIWARDCLGSGAAFGGILIDWKEDGPKEDEPRPRWLIGHAMTETLENAYSEMMDSVGDVEMARGKRVTRYTIHYRNAEDGIDNIPYVKGKNVRYIYQIDPKTIHISEIFKKLTDPSIFKSVHTLCKRWD